MNAVLETHVHVPSTRDTHVAECVSRQERTCTSVSDRDDFPRLGKLVEDDRLCLDSVPLLQAFIRHRHGDSNAWTIVWRQHSIEHRRPDRISATGYLLTLLRAAWPWRQER